VAERYPVLWIGRVAMVTLPAEIDITIADAVREDLLSVINKGATLLVADMSATTFCDSSGVSALVRTYRRAMANACDVRLVISSPAVARVLSLTGVDRLMPVFGSIAASLAGTPPEPGPRSDPPDSAIAPADSDVPDLP